MRDELLRNVIVRVLENRFMLHNRQGSLRERLARCKAAAKRHAAMKQQHLDAHIRQLRALSHNRFAELSDRNYEQLFLDTLAGKGSAESLHAIEEHVRNLDGDVFVTERAPELLASIFYQYYRAGFNSPTIAESLGLSAPQVRQILFRANRIARKEESQTTTPRQRARKRQLTKEKACEIRRLAASGAGWQALAEQFGVGRHVVEDVVRRKTWKGAA
jgi:transposase